MILQVQVRFLNKQETDCYSLSKKSYTYLIRDGDIPNLKVSSDHVPYCFGDYLYSAISYQIVHRGTGSDYNNARVVITGMVAVSDEVAHKKGATKYEYSYVNLYNPKVKSIRSYNDFDFNEEALKELDEIIRNRRENMRTIATNSSESCVTKADYRDNLYYSTDGSSYTYIDADNSYYRTISDSIYDKIHETLSNYAEIKPNDPKGEENNMFDNMVKGIEFGVAKDVKFSLYGPAFKNKENRYIALAADGQSYDVTGLTIDELNGMNYMFPAAAADIVKGDYVRHNNEWVKVLDKGEDNSLKVLKMSSNEEVTVHPIKNLFGFNYYTKLLTVCGEMTGTPDEKNPFGNILPLMMLSDKSDGNKMLPLMFLMNQGGEMKMDMNNPLFLMALMK